MSMKGVKSESSEHLARWSDKWQNKNIGWHNAEVHDALTTYNDLIFGESCRANREEAPRVLVPLCGKTLDMAYLAKHEAVKEVVGVDGIQTALDEFIEENKDLGIKKTEAHNGHFDSFRGKNINLLKGDFFDLDPETTGGQFDVIFDRASMVAIEPRLRHKYVDIIGKMLRPGGKLLLVVIERSTGTDADKDGPPFSVSEEDVRSLYSQPWVKSITPLSNEGNKDGANALWASYYYLIQAAE